MQGRRYKGEGETQNTITKKQEPSFKKQNAG